MPRRKERRLQVGDYLRYDRFRGEQLDEPLWAIVTDTTAIQGRADILLKGSAAYLGSSFTFLIAAQADKASYVVLTEAEVPDYVFVALAKRALLGVDA